MWVETVAKRSKLYFHKKLLCYKRKAWIWLLKEMWLFWSHDTYIKIRVYVVTFCYKFKQISKFNYNFYLHQQTTFKLKNQTIFGVCLLKKLILIWYKMWYWPFFFATLMLNTENANFDPAYSLILTFFLLLALSTLVLQLVQLQLWWKQKMSNHHKFLQQKELHSFPQIFKETPSTGWNLF